MGEHTHRCHCPSCALHDARARYAEQLPIFVVYDHPSDFPEHVVLQLWLYDKPTNRTWTFASIEGARAAVPGGLFRLPAQPGDDPKILETWL